MVVYMKVSRDKYKLPVAIADSPQKLADICNVKIGTVMSSIYKSKGNSSYLKVFVDESEEDDDE